MKNIITLFVLLSAVQAISQITFTEYFHPYDTLPYLHEAAHGDLNGDGIDDFVLSSYNEKKLIVGINNDLQQPSFVTINEGADVRFLAVHDVDQDDDLDIVGSVLFDDESYFWKNDGSGNFTAELLPVLDYISIHFADMDGDGVAEMLLGVDDKLNIYDIAGGTVSLEATVVDNPFLDDPDAIYALDYNHDDVMDIAAVFSGDGVKVFQQSGSYNFTQLDILPETFNNIGLAATDINDDMLADFLLFNAFSTKTSILKSTISGDYEEEILPENNGANMFSTFGDINQDSILDVLYTEETSIVNGTISIFISDGDSLIQQIVNENYAGVAGGGITDLDGDGDNDIFIYANDVFDTGLVYFINETPVDADNDGYTSDVDCDDGNPDVNPGEDEIVYNGLDDDCDPATLDDDLDEDGFLLADDCDDNNPDINPGEVETAYNGLDDDCDPATLDDDLDEDGFLLADDCDDGNPDINPDAVEIADNGIDEDCDGMDLVTSIHELADATIRIFPNPATNYINLILPDHLEIRVNLYDASGQLVFSGVNDQMIYLEDVGNGIYLLEVTDLFSNKKVVDRIVVLK